MQPKLELGLDPTFESGQSQRLEPLALEGQHAVIGDIGQRLPAGKVEAAPVSLGGPRREAAGQGAVAFLDEPLECAGVDRQVGDLERVATTPRRDPDLRAQERA